jgi:anti-anti-sigma factor
MTGGVPVVVVIAPPEIDITNADQLRAVLLDTATPREDATVVVDLTLTRFCDSYGPHTLLRAHKLAQADGGELRPKHMTGDHHGQSAGPATLLVIAVDAILGPRRP